MRNMLRNYALLVMLAAGCSTEVEPAPEALSKVDAASALNAGTLTYDACARYGWYDDDVCDTFCTQTDTDCSSDGGPVMCAQFIEESDAKCSRKGDDPCRFQDPDCNVSAPPNDPGDDTVCALFVSLPDGVCSRAADDPCRRQDLDCGARICWNVRPDTPDGDCRLECYDSDPDCKVKPLPTDDNCESFVPFGLDGVCNFPEGHQCRSYDDDCTDGGDGIVCAAYIEETNGICSRPSVDPCRHQDPDCTNTP
jgi:hypothetical protein